MLEPHKEVCVTVCIGFWVPTRQRLELVGSNQVTAPRWPEVEGGRVRADSALACLVLFKDYDCKIGRREIVVSDVEV